MGSTVWGADVAQLRTLAQTFGKASESLLQQSSQLGQSINSAQAWKGPDAVRFKSEWNSSHRTVLMNAASALKKQSRFLLTQADEQETASNAAHGSGGGPLPGGPGGGPGGNGGGGPFDWLEKGSPFRDAWKLRGGLKAPFDLLKNGTKLWVDGYPEFVNLMDSRAVLADSVRNSKWFATVQDTSDFLGQKNLNKFFPMGEKAAKLFAEEKWLFQGKGEVLESLGKGGLGRGLGWAGVGLNAFDTVNNFAKGDVSGGIESGAKTALAVGSFLPPPAGTVCAVASAAWAVYDIPVVKEFVNGAVSHTVDAVANAGKTVGKGLADVGKGAAKFFGFG
ncbi:hypothetical protein [Arthrobacter sp. RCC_34]|uniref:hypothetical protein n=1 Tax=Arthrobacter sp. RCC_34 TaxID=3239230 RepID=UPI0035250160